MVAEIRLLRWIYSTHRRTAEQSIA